MNGLIRASLRNPYAVTVMAFTLLIMGALTLTMIPIDILPVFKSPAVQVLTFYGGMPAEAIEKDITNRMERWVGQSNGLKRQESRSIVGASIVRNYFQDDVDPNGALTQVNSLALSTLPNLPPGTLPPVVLPFDPTSSTPVCLVALDSKTQSESILYDVGRYEVRPMVMSNPGAVAPVVYGGEIRAVMLYLDRIRMQARGLSPLDVMSAMDNYNVFLPNGSVKMGDTDYAIASNSLYDLVDRMGDMPLTDDPGNRSYVKDVAKPKDSAFIQTNIVRVNGRAQVYIPVYRQLGSSTLDVVDTLRHSINDMQTRLTRPGIDLKLVMDQSVYVRASIHALAQEGVLGAILCSLVILLFLGEWRMTIIAIMTLPLAVMGAVICLHATGNTINVMTLAGLALAIGPMVDSAIICLENTHRHLGLGASPHEAAYHGASEVAMPELIATLCTFLVLAPLALMPGMGRFLFRPMALAVAFAMICAYLLSRSLVPAFAAILLKPHGIGHGHGEGEHGEGHSAPHHKLNVIARAFAVWEGVIESAIAKYVRLLDRVMNHRVLTVAASFALLAGVIVYFSPILRREFFPEVDAGAFQFTVRAPSGTRIENTQKSIAQVEDAIHKSIDEHDLQLVLSEIGLTADWSAAYTPNSGPMDAIIKVQLSEHRHHSAQHYADVLRENFRKNPRFSQLQFAFDTGGMVRGALNEGKSTPLNVRITGKNMEVAHQIAENIKAEVAKVPGIVDAQIVQRLNYPEVQNQRRSLQGGRLGLDPRRCDAERRGRGQLEHLIQQKELLDRPGELQPVLRGRAVSRRADRLARYALGCADHRSEPIAPGAAAVNRHRHAGHRPHGSDARQHSADHRPDDGRVGPGLGTRRRRCVQTRRQLRQVGRSGRLGSLRPAPSQVGSNAGRLENRAERGILPDAGHIPQPGDRTDPGFAVDLLPDGGPGAFVGRAADGDAGGAALADRRVDAAIRHRDRPQRAVAIGHYFRGRH